MYLNDRNPFLFQSDRFHAQTEIHKGMDVLAGRISASSFLHNKEEGHDLSPKYPLTNAFVIEWEQISVASRRDLVENYPRRAAALIGTIQRLRFEKVKFKM